MINNVVMPECENCEESGRPSRFRSHYLLVDPERARREDEHERRKLRLLQVREESRKLAHKIRQDVAAEKQRQLDKFNATKATEMECWRRNAMAEEDERYTWAVCHLGMAHNAAMLENASQKNLHKHCNRECSCMFQKSPCKTTSSHHARRSRKSFTKSHRNQLKCFNAEKKPLIIPMHLKERQTGGECCVPGCPQNQKCTCSHETDIEEEKSLPSDTDEHNNSCELDLKESVPKVPVNSNNNSYCSIENVSVTSVTSLSSHSIVEDNTSNKELTEAEMPNRCCTPTVLVDVEVGPQDCIEITSPYYGDCFCKDNIKFNRIVISNPRKTEACKSKHEPIEAESSSKFQPSTECSTKTSTIGSESSKLQVTSSKLLEFRKPQKAPTSIKKNTKISKRIAPSPGKSTILPPKRKTVRAVSRVIPVLAAKKSMQPKSKLKSNNSRILKQNIVDKSIKQSISQKRNGKMSKPPTVVQPSNFPITAKETETKSKLVTTKEVNTQTMEEKQSEKLPFTQSLVISKTTSSIKSVQCQTSSKEINIVNNSKPKLLQENKNAVSQDFTSTNTKSDNLKTGAVLTYDYNSKLTNKYVPVNKVIDRNLDRSKPTAMEEAKKENSLRQKLNEELKEKSLIMDNRCQKALEKEQIRQDYYDLSEKLEELLQKYPDDLPSTIKTAQMVADKRLRLENKLATAIENLLNKPAIITCPEVKEKIVLEKSKVSAKNNEEMLNELNVGESSLETDDLSKSSCCSLLLEYVNDQVKEVQKDLDQGEVTDDRDEAKKKRLCYLLERLDRLRNSLLNYLDKTKDENVAIEYKDNNINEQESTVNRNDLQNEKPINVENEKKVKSQHETSAVSIQEKLTNSEQKLHSTLSSPKRRYPGKIQKPDGSSTIARERRLLKNSENNPLEIIITVRGESRSVEVPATIKNRAIRTCSKPVESNDNQGSIQKTSVAQNSVPSDQEMKLLKPIAELVETTETSDQCKSFNSNSTSYRSLPLNVDTKLSVITKNLNGFMDNHEDKSLNYQQKVHSNRNMNNEKSKTYLEDRDEERAEVNPMLAHYIQKLLKMPRSAVQALGVSSSEIETPPFSVINSTNNKNCLDATLLQNDEQINRVETFLEDNRNFIKDLESTLEAHSQISLDTSRQIFDEIWRCRLAEQRLQKTSKDSKIKPNSKVITKKNNEILSKSTQKLPEKKNLEAKVLCQNLDISERRNIECVSKNISEKPINECKFKVDKSVEAQACLSQKEQIGKNCVNRIAELTQLIKKVRMEKQRIMEITISSISENGGQRSTDGIEAITSERTSDTQNQEVYDHRENTSISSKHQSKEEAECICVCRKENIKNNIKNVEKTCGNECICHQNNLPEKVDVGVNIPSSESLSPFSNSSRLRDESKVLISSNTRGSTSCKSSEKNQSLSYNIKNKQPEKMKGDAAATQNSCLSHLPNSNMLKEDCKSGSPSIIKQSRISRSPAKSCKINQIASKDICPPTVQRAANNVILGSEMKCTSSMIRDTKEKYHPQKHYLAHKESNAAHIKKPPPTLCRYNTDVIEGNTAHKLSTIAESDKSSLVDKNITVKDANCGNGIEPVLFPSFEEYMKWLNLSVMDLDAEQSVKLENEFLMYIDALKTCPIENVLEYKSFPTISRYILQNAQESNWSFLSQHSGSNSDPNASNRLQTLEPEPFKQSSPQRSCNSNSNLNSDNDSTPMNLEDELKRRNIIKQSYDERPYKRIASGSADNYVEDEVFAISSSSSPQIMQKVITEGLSTLEEEYIDCMQLELKRLLLNWSKCMNENYQKVCEDSSNSSSVQTSRKKSKTTTEEDHSSCKLGKPISLRQFLTRELVKHATGTSSSSSTSATDDALRSKFLQAVIDNMTTSTDESVTNNNSHKTRKKTSTPLQQFNSSENSRGRNATSSQLFSGESHISSVPYLEPRQNPVNKKIEQQNDTSENDCS